MGQKDSESIAAVLKRAQEAPDDTGGASASVPQLFSQFPIPTGEPVVDNEPAPEADGRRINGVPRYNMDSHLRRFIIGQEVVGTNERGQPETAERDDSREYEDLINKILNGEGALRWEEKQHLKDGTLVISVCYFTVRETKQTEAQKESAPLFDTKS